jgi:HAD superfamily hydrolase (TIGR01457 family)
MSQRALVDAYDAVLLDLDGVVYAGTRAVPHAAEVLGELRRRQVPLAFVTNNASRTPEAVATLLKAVGVEASPAEVATSAQAAARLLSATHPAGAPVLVIGGEGLVEAVRGVGLRPVTSADQEPVAVVQGYHPDVGWRSLAEASVAVRAGAQWIATNTDLTIPSDRGVLPGNGTLVNAVAAATGREPDAVAGKPARPLHDEAVLRTGGTRPIVVGDRLDTDIEGAQAVGVDSLLVLTGVTSPAELVALRGARPTYVAADLRGLLAPQSPVVVTEGASECGGWAVRARGARLSVEGAGEPVDALRAVLALSWALVDSGDTPALSPPPELAGWWRGG